MRRFNDLMKLVRTGGVLGIGLILAADVAMAQPPGGERRPDESGRGGQPGGSGGRGRGGFGGFGGMEPSLSRELRRETFAEKINLTEEQKQLLNELDMERSEFFRSMPRGGGGPGTPDFDKRMQDIQDRKSVV